MALNKSDLVDRPARDRFRVAAVAAAGGGPVACVSAERGTGMNVVAKWIGRGETAVLAGSSGVGKSSIANRLLGTQEQFTMETRDRDGKGRHATTERQLLLLPGGGLLLDSPGTREFGVWTEAGAVEDAFDEFTALAAACAFRDCTHLHEPRCAVRAAVAAGAIDPRRYAAYEKLLRERDFLASRADEIERRKRHRREKNLSRKGKDAVRRKRGDE